jgi:aspartate-semialdehyde dehydrogenase
MRGKELSSLLEKRDLPATELDFFDPEAQEAYSMLTQFKGEARIVQHLKPGALDGEDLVFLASDKKTNKKYGLLAGQGKYRAFDLEESFSLRENVFLAVSGVNDNRLLEENPYLLANPHPVSIFLSHFLHLIRRTFDLKSMISFILQPASAFGEPGIAELADQSAAILSSSNIVKKVFRSQAAFNLLSQTERVDKNGFSGVEKQIVFEVRRILGSRDLPLSLSLLQTPVFHTYSIMSFVELEKPAEKEKLEALFNESPYFQCFSPSTSCPVSSLNAAGKESIYIGQIKKDNTVPRGFWVWATLDNLTRGSALNALETAETILEGKTAE